MNLTNSGVKRPRSSLKRFFASSLSSLYIALDNCRSLTSSGTSSPRASQSTSTTSMELFSTAIFVNDLSLSISALGSTLTVSNQFLILIGITTNPVSNKTLTTPLLSSWTASCWMKNTSYCWLFPKKIDDFVLKPRDYFSLSPASMFDPLCQSS